MSYSRVENLIILLTTFSVTESQQQKDAYKKP